MTEQLTDLTMRPNQLLRTCVMQLDHGAEKSEDFWEASRRAEYISRSIPAHSRDDPKYSPHNGANEPLILERGKQYLQVRAKG